MTDLRVAKRRTMVRTFVPNPAVILVLVPLFLIISSSVLPAIISTIQNKEISMIAKAVAKLSDSDQSRNAYTVSKDKNQPVLSNSIGSRSPTPLEPSPTFIATPSNIPSPQSSSSTPSSSVLSHTMKTNVSQNIIQEDEIVTTTAITPGDQVHVVWDDDSPGNEEVLYKRDGTDFDPTTVNLSETGDISSNPAIAVQGNNVHVVWREGADRDLLYEEY